MHDIATRSPYTGLSTFFIDEHADEIALLTGRLSLTPLQAVFIALFYRWRHAPVDLCKLYDHTCTYYLRWNDSHFDAVDSLVALGYLDITVIDRRDHYRLNPDALKSILRGEPYRSDQAEENESLPEVEHISRHESSCDESSDSDEKTDDNLVTTGFMAPPSPSDSPETASCWFNRLYDNCVNVIYGSILSTISTDTSQMFVPIEICKFMLVNDLRARGAPPADSARVARKSTLKLNCSY